MGIVDEWPFDQAANVAAVSDAAVVDDGAPVVVVVHYSEDHSWAFLSGRGQYQTENGKVIGMGTALRLDPSLCTVADLQHG
jgi:mannose-6-phosphate isomerase-like protein (cupin superfamily)